METAPHVGVMLPTREALRLGARVAIDFGARAEAFGFDSVWAGDSLLARPLLDPLTTLAAVAARTSSIRLGTAVLLAPLYQPVVAARAIASVDQLSDGRLILGVGRGFDLPETRREFAAAEVDFETRTKRMTEAIELWRSLWDGSADGPFDLQPRPVQPGGPPIWLAGYGPASFRRVAHLADGWLPYPPSAEQYREGWAAIQAQAGPRTVTPAVMVTIAVHDDPAVADKQLDRYAETFYGYPREIVGLLQAMAAGPPDVVLSVLRGYWEAGARTFLLRLASLDEPQSNLSASPRTCCRH
jgi:alkanesulfonate monooxygenase SsuD/methylene tetrahydromethanopterin reductase-like flavin-dependent oxidoreductase (luciferase family)